MSPNLFEHLADVTTHACLAGFAVGQVVGMLVVKAVINPERR